MSVAPLSRACLRKTPQKVQLLRVPTWRSDHRRLQKVQLLRVRSFIIMERGRGNAVAGCVKGHEMQGMDQGLDQGVEQGSFTGHGCYDRAICPHHLRSWWPSQSREVRCGAIHWNTKNVIEKSIKCDREAKKCDREAKKCDREANPLEHKKCDTTASGNVCGTAHLRNNLIHCPPIQILIWHDLYPCMNSGSKRWGLLEPKPLRRIKWEVWDPSWKVWNQSEERMHHMTQPWINACKSSCIVIMTGCFWSLLFAIF